MDYQKKYKLKSKRIDEAIYLNEPDQIPCIPMLGTFPYINAGFKMSEVLYDVEKGKAGIKKFLEDFDPDLNISYKSIYAGLGPFFEMLGCKFLNWAGGPDSVCDEYNMHQFIEKEYLEENEYDEYLSNSSKWIQCKWLPRNFSNLEALSKVDFDKLLGLSFASGTVPFADDNVMDAFTLLHKAGKFYKNWLIDARNFEEEMAQLGYPPQWSAVCATAFDYFSDSTRGTLGILTDLYNQPENVMSAINKIHKSRVISAKKQAEGSKGKFVLIPLHKGFDNLMSDYHYRKFYWDTLLKLVNELIDNNLTPYVYTEGPYNSRIECLMDLPKGKTLIHFEQADLKKAKKLLGNVSCLSGGVSETLLCTGTTEQVKNAVKENLDILAPGGGCIFDISDSLNYCKPENVEAMFNTVKTYGKK